MKNLYSTFVSMKSAISQAKKMVCIFFTIILTVLFTQKSSAQVMNFDSRILISGSDNTVGAIYRFQNVQSGVDAIVSVDSIVGGAVLKDVDKSGWGYTAAFQPFIQPPNGVNISAYVVFTMKFVTTNTFNSFSIPSLSMTALDIDGNNIIKEFDIMDMGGGTTTYLSSPTEISITSIGTGFMGVNIGGAEHGGPDTTQKTDIFTVTNLNVQQLTFKVGTNGQTTSNASRKYSFITGEMYYPNGPINLPVKLESFNAFLNNNKVDLKWTTATEFNVSHFVIEKSLDGKNFSDAGMVFAFGNTTEKKNYDFIDNINGSQAGVIYYRLRSVDIDGKSNYSATRIIRIGKQTEQTITILTYPNPVSNELRITLPNNWQNKKVTIEIYNANGQVAKRSENANSGQTEIVNVSNMTPGFYMVKANCEGVSAQQKIVKQ